MHYKKLISKGSQGPIRLGISGGAGLRDCPENQVTLKRRAMVYADSRAVDESYGAHEIMRFYFLKCAVE